MDDHRPWIKLWKTFRSDPALAQMTLEQQARWIHLLLFVAENGQEGVYTAPARAAWQQLGSALRAAPQRRHRDGLSDLISGFPGTRLEAHSGTVTVTFVNWRKYQESNSTARTRRWREKRHGDGHSDAVEASHEQSHERRSVTKKRGEVDKNPLSPVTANGQPDPAIPYAQRTDRQIWTADGYPRTAFRTDCPDEAWRLRCVSPAFLKANPEWRGKLPDGPRGTCPDHRAKAAYQWP